MQLCFVHEVPNYRPILQFLVELEVHLPRTAALDSDRMTQVGNGLRGTADGWGASLSGRGGVPVTEGFVGKFDGSQKKESISSFHIVDCVVLAWMDGRSGGEVQEGSHFQ